MSLYVVVVDYNLSGNRVYTFTNVKSAVDLYNRYRNNLFIDSCSVHEINPNDFFTSNVLYHWERRNERRDHE